MSLQEDLKVNDYFMKDYSKAEVLKTFKTMIGRFGRTGEMEGKLEDLKIVQIDEKVITVETKMKDSNDIRLYRMSLEFPQMENEEFSREAKIASPERVGEITELKRDADNSTKAEYFEKRVDYWDNQEEIAKRIENTIKANNLIEKYGKANIYNVIDTMVENSRISGDILGDVLDYKIAKIEGTEVSVAIKTKDEKVRIYRINLDFDKVNNIGFTDEAKANSVTRAGSTKELQTSIMSDEEKTEYYDQLPNILGEEREEREDQERSKE